MRFVIWPTEMHLCGQVYMKVEMNYHWLHILLATAVQHFFSPKLFLQFRKKAQSFSLQINCQLYYWYLYHRLCLLSFSHEISFNRYLKTFVCSCRCVSLFFKLIHIPKILKSRKYYSIVAANTALLAVINTVYTPAALCLSCYLV